MKLLFYKNLKIKALKIMLFYGLIVHSFLAFSQTSSTVQIIPPCRVWIDINTRFLEPGYIAFDSNNINITTLVQVSGNLDTSKAGRYVLNYCLVDSGRLPVCAHRTVFVGEPTWRLSADGNIPIRIAVGTNADTLAGIESYLRQTYLLNVSLDSGFIDLDVLGDYGAKYTLYDSSCGNFQIQIKATVIDEIGPYVNLNGPDTICNPIGEIFIDPSVIATDNYWPSSKLIATTNGAVNINVPGFYTIVYRVTDPSGNFTEVVRVVEVGNCGVLGIEMPEEVNFSIYPQPAKESVTIKSDKLINIGLLRVKLIDVLGLALNTPIEKVDDESVIIKLENIAAGLYFIVIENERGSFTKRVVVGH